MTLPARIGQIAPGIRICILTTRRLFLWQVILVFDLFGRNRGALVGKWAFCGRFGGEEHRVGNRGGKEATQMTACNVKLDAVGDGGQTKVGLLEAVLGNGGLGLKIAKKGGCRSNSRSSLEILLHVADELVGHPRVLRMFSIMKSLEYRTINKVRKVGESSEDQGVNSRVVNINNNDTSREKL